MDKVKYAVTIHCVYEGPVEETFEKCMIRPATFEDDEYDGMNYVFGACKETFDFYIVDDLEEAILSTHFNPNTIEFVGLDRIDLVRKDEILSKYGWDPMNGVYRKVFLRENNDFMLIRKSEYNDLKCTIDNSKRELAQEFYNLSEEWGGGVAYYKKSRKLAEEYGAKSSEVK